MKFHNIQQEIFAKRAGLLEENYQLDEWTTLAFESEEFDPQDVTFALDLLEEIEQIVEALPKAAYVAAMKRTQDYDTADKAADPAKIVARAKKYHGDKFAKDLESGAKKMHGGRKTIHDYATDKLASRQKTRVTASGKAHKQSVQALKNTIKWDKKVGN